MRLKLSSDRFKKRGQSVLRFSQYALWPFLLVLVISIVAAVIIKGRQVTVEVKSFQEAPGQDKEEKSEPRIRKPVKVRGIYMTSWTASSKNLRSNLVTLVKETELNAVVIDIKDYTGKVAFQTENPMISAVGSSYARIGDLKEFIDELHQDNIYVIARMQIFQDPVLAHARPDLAVKNKSGKIWKDHKGLSWIDPASMEAWRYNIEVAKEAEQLGFDEINVDYVRFPSDGNLSDMVFPLYDSRIPKREVIAGFLAFLADNLKPTGVFLSADLFGLTLWEKKDLNIGQVLEDAVIFLDYVSPMVYPSHYPPHFDGYKNPALYPYEVLSGNFARAKERLNSDFGKLRPWLQDFDLGADYDARMVRKQMQAVYDAGLEEWLLWSPSNVYTRGALQPEVAANP